MVRVETALDRLGEGLFDKIAGVGAHEVVIESPRHEDTLASLDDDGIARVLWALRERAQDLRRDVRFRCFVMFKNHGAAAGASLAHSHTQLLALPVVPREAQAELDGARAHYAAKERCLFCDIVRQEEEDGRRVIARTPEMLALAPFASRSPFETWILPRRHAAWFEDVVAGPVPGAGADSGRRAPPARPCARAAAVFAGHPLRARGRGARLLSLARGDPAARDARRQPGVDDRLSPEPDHAGGCRASPATAELELVTACSISSLSPCHSW